MITKADHYRHIAFMADAVGNSRRCEPWGLDIVYSFRRDKVLEEAFYIRPGGVDRATLRLNMGLMNRQLAKVLSDDF